MPRGASHDCCNKIPFITAYPLKSIKIIRLEFEALILLLPQIKRKLMANAKQSTREATTAKLVVRTVLFNMENREDNEDSAVGIPKNIAREIFLLHHLMLLDFPIKYKNIMFKDTTTLMRFI